jgi:hypothetical protein
VIRRSPVPLKDFEDWLELAEALLGRQDIPENSLAAHLTSLKALEEYEEKLDSEFYMDMDPVYRLGERFPWLDSIEDIARQQGFFHWELRFGQVFADGGFDLQLGNPPWVRPRWNEDLVLAELDPWFELAESIPPSEHNGRKKDLLASPRAREFFLGEMTEQAAVVSFFGGVATYDLLAGTQPDFYRVFMLRAWSNLTKRGVAGLIHPDTHMAGNHEGRLRASAYRHLRLHAHFQNRRLIFPDVDWNKQFGIHIYGSGRAVDFTHISWLFDPDPLVQSLSHDGTGEAPGIKYDRSWDLRPHRKRLIRVDQGTLEGWRLLSGDLDTPVNEVKILYPVSTDEQKAIGALANVERRLASLIPQMSRGYDEANAKKAGLIRWETSDPGDWAEVILRGPQINIATPIAKQPPNTKHTDKPVDLASLSDSAVARTDYLRATDPVTYQRAQDRWLDGRVFSELMASSAKVADARAWLAKAQSIDQEDVSPEQIEDHLRQESMRRYTEFYRVAWREMIPASTERSLFPALIPPGPAHIHAVRSMALSSNRTTALVAGFWATIPLDYALRIGGRGHLDVADARTMPVPALDHLLSEALLLRALRLNCLTTAYDALWREIYRDSWGRDEWAAAWPGLERLSAVGPVWTHNTPLRTERARRAALVELDVLAAIMLEISADELIAIYKSRFPQLVDYESDMWFAADGRKLAANFNQWGYGQTKEHYEQLMAYINDPEKRPPPVGYTPPFYKADRIAEYRQAHSVFSERLRRAREGGNV